MAESSDGQRSTDVQSVLPSPARGQYGAELVHGFRSRDGGEGQWVARCGRRAWLMWCTYPEHRK